MVLDTPSLYFRAFHGIPDTFRAPDGSPVNAVRGLLDFIARLVSVRTPTRLVAAMDADWRPAFRVAAIPSYKTHRLAVAAPPGTEIVPDELAPQIPVIVEVLEALGVPVFGVDGYEADDVIGTLATSSQRPVDVVTGDRDLFQLVDDERGVRVLYVAARGVGNHDVVDEAWVEAKYGIPGRAYADFATLRGDPSDGLPGVPGVGDKTAAALITKYRSLEELLRALDAGDTGMPAGARAKLVAARDYLVVAPVVVATAHDVPLPAYDDTIPALPRDADRLLELAERWGLDRPLNRVLNAFAAVQNA
ncbi:MAG TPA: 5'-3' exonuclease [Actinomycetes bacterium]|nr:5'-3' exonuclease [Actinomycetes bacterium]